MKKLQLALDLRSGKEAKKILDEVGEYVDIIELGTPLIISEGMKIVREIKALYPEKLVFADIKLMDGGRNISDMAFSAGADMVSVLAVANDATIKEVIEMSRKHKKSVLIDMCAVKDIGKRARELEPLIPDYMCVHVAFDIQGTGIDPIEEVKKLNGINCKKAAAGGITLATFENACQSDIDDIIVGGGLAKVEDRLGTAKKMYHIINKYR